MTRVRRLTVVLALNLALIAGLVIVGLRARSLGVLAAGVDYLADASAIGLSLLAIWLQARPPRPGRPGGHPHATNVAALVNAGWLLVVTIGVIVTGAKRLASGTPRVDGLPVLIASAVAAVAMLAGALVLRGDADGDDEDLNVKAVLLDTVADAAAAGGVAIAGGIILAVGGWYWLDPTVAVAIAVVVGYQAVRLVLRVILAIRSPMRAEAAPGPNR